MMSTVIKAGEAGRIVKHLSTVDLADHLSEVRSVVADARRHASQLVADAEAQAVRLREEARKSGYEEGHREGYEAGTQTGHEAAYDETTSRLASEHADIVTAMERAISEIDSMKEGLKIAAERDLLEFAVMLASRLTFAIGRLHSESVVANLERVLRVVESKTDLAIHVHPDQVASIETFAESVLRKAHTSRFVDIVPDESIDPGGCRVECDQTRVDATLETQVAEIVALLLGEKVSDG